MANWTNSSGCFMRPVRSPFGSPQVRKFQTSTGGSTAAVNVGDIVRSNTLVTTGGFRVRRDPSTGGNGAHLVHIGGAQLIGIAAETVSTFATAGTNFVDDSSSPGLVRNENLVVGVFVADGVTEFLGYFKSGGAGTTPIAASSLIGATRPVMFDSTLARYFIDSTNSTAAGDLVMITDFPDYALGDSGGVPAYFKFLSSNVHPAVRIGGVSV